MPDLHPGKGIPIGAAVLTDQAVAYPQLVDNDIGCGMSFIQTQTKASSINANKLQKLADNFTSIDCPFGSKEKMLAMNKESMEWGSHKLGPLEDIEDYHLNNIGTIGGGNHFAEF